MSGEEGLIHCLANAFAKAGVSSISLGEIRNRFKADPEGDAWHGYLQQLRDALVANSIQNTPEPTLILPIDQGEELYASDGAEESTQLRAQLACLNRRDVSTPLKQGGLSLIALITIRTDLYAPLQNDALLRDMGRQKIDLTPMDRAEYKRIIEGPAQQATEAGKSPVMTPDLVEQLLADTHGADALPMLVCGLIPSRQYYRLLSSLGMFQSESHGLRLLRPHSSHWYGLDSLDAELGLIGKSRTSRAFAVKR